MFKWELLVSAKLEKKDIPFSFRERISKTFQPGNRNNHQPLFNRKKNKSFY